MTMPPSDRGARWTDRVRTRAAILAALLLARLSPRRLRRVLQLMAGQAKPATYQQTEQYYRAVASASPHCAGWQGCLPRSVAVGLLCRRKGSWPTWNIGVRSTPPFAAHAWLEAEGRIVAEPGTPDAYRSLMRVEAAHHVR